VPGPTAVERLDLVPNPIRLTETARSVELNPSLIHDRQGFRMT
jgi:hypothetical protein